MKDFKKMVKMADGGSVAERFQQSVIDRLKERFPDAEPQKVERKAFENSAERGIRQLRGGTGAGTGSAGEIKALTNPRAMKSGGKVKRGNKK